MLVRCHVALFAVCLSAAGQSGGRVSDLVAAVRDEIARHRSDSQAAKALRKVKLVERLDDRTVEILQSEGAGSETAAQLLLLRDQSAGLPKPAAPPIAEPPAPSPAAQVRIWNAAHENADVYTDSLPDFICSEVVRRYSDSNEKRGWKLDDTLILRLTYFEKEEEYKLMSVNNHATSLSYEQVNGAITEGEFGTLLSKIFDLKSRTNRDWDHWTVLRSRPTHVYTFSILAANSDYGITAGVPGGGSERVKAGQHGYLYIDDATRMVVRVTAVTDGLPPDFPVQKVDLQLDYDFLDVGGKQYLLPLHSETSLIAPPMRHRNETDFLGYRKFSADATITYDGTVKK
jgi:hypothetical protein